MPPLRDSDRQNLIDEDTGREHLSHSALSMLLACPQKYAFGYDQQLELKQRSTPLSLGSAFQLAVEHGDPAAGASALADERSLWSQQDADQLQVDMQVVICAATLYLKRFGELPRGVREFGYRVRLRNPWTGSYSRTFDLLGFADELIDEGAYFTLVENKLVGQITELSLRKLPLDRQLALECYGIWRATGLPVRQVKYRWIRKPSIRQRKGESADEFCERLSADFVEREDFYSHEEQLLRSTEDLARVEGELWQWAEQVRELRRARLAPRNTSICSEYGGCQFLPLCLHEPGGELLFRRKVRADVEHARNVGSQPVTAAAYK